MSEILIDPALVGIWLVPGASQTYEITDAGSYFIAEPDDQVHFQNDGSVMVWGYRRYIRTEGAGNTPVGTWREEDTGDGWDFTADQAVTILIADPEQDDSITGIWALRDAGKNLWVCEERARITCDGAHLVFHTVEGDSFRYGYTVNEDVLSLMDPDNWTELTRYVSAALFIQTVAASAN